MPTKVILIFDTAKLFSKKRNTKTTGKCHIPYSHTKIVSLTLENCRNDTEKLYV